MSNFVYDTARQAFANAQINLGADSIKAALVDGNYTPNQSTDQYWSQVNTHVVGSPVALAGITDTAGVLKANNVTFPAVSGNQVVHLVLFKDTGTAATSQLIAHIDTGTNLPVTPNGGDLDIAWDATNGIFKL